MILLNLLWYNTFMPMNLQYLIARHLNSWRGLIHLNHLRGVERLRNSVGSSDKGKKKENAGMRAWIVILGSD